MHRYFIKTPWLVKKLFPSYVWQMKDDAVYLTFDDGPHPAITPWVLSLLKQYNAEATFFCIGDNVARYPEVYRQITEAGHAVGNHTYHHLNGWKTDTATYTADVAAASNLIRSSLFRPPYGRIRSAQAAKISAMQVEASIVMWDVLSGDFDRHFTPSQCFHHVAQHVTGGSIVVFHDSEKAFPNLHFALPAVLDHLSAAGYRMKKIG